MAWAVIGVVTSVVSSVGVVPLVGAGLAIKGARDAKKAGKAGAAAQTALNRLQNDQNKRDFLRKFRQAQANTILSGVASGVGLESSLVRGSLQSESSQKNTALLEFQEADDLGASIIGSQQKQANATANSQIAGSAASFAAQFISFDTPKPKGE